VRLLRWGGHIGCRPESEGILMSDSHGVGRIITATESCAGQHAESRSDGTECSCDACRWLRRRRLEDVEKVVRELSRRLALAEECIDAMIGYHTLEGHEL